MATPPRNFVNNGVYHVYNRGVEKRNIFPDKSYYQHFRQTLAFYKEEQNQRLSFHLKGVKPLKDEKTGRNLVAVLAYCFMPNHFHLLLKQLTDEGISKFTALVLNSYTKYFNKRTKRVGPLFQGRFKAKRIKSDESFLQVSRYIHLNPLELFHLRGATEKVYFIRSYPYSSYQLYLNAKYKDQICERGTICGLAGSLKGYRHFVESKINSNPKIGIEPLILE